MKTKNISLVILGALVMLLCYSSAEALSSPTLSAAVVSSSQINLSWSDTNNSQTYYNVYRQGQFIYRTGYGMHSYNNTGLSSSTTYSFKVVAVVGSNNTAASNTVSATTFAAADTTPPTVSISSPTSGASYTTAQTVTITASASDNVGVTKVEFYDGTALKATDTTSPYTYAWAFTSANNGAHSLTAKAYDAVGHVTTSTAVSLTVNIASTDTTPPTVSISSPTSGTSYTTAQTVTITASASDNVGVAKVEFYDGTALKATDTTSPYTYAWAFTSANNGAHSWTAKAYDAAGHVTTSTAVSLTVNIASADTTPPSVPTGLTATAASSSQINLSWSPSTDTGGSGLAGYKIYRAGTQIGTSTSTNYSSSGLTANTQFCYTVAAYDNAGNVSAQSSQSCATTQGTTSSSAQAIWAKRFGGTSYDRGMSVATDSVGNVIVGGYFQGTVDFGCGALTATGLRDMFVAKYSPTGGCLWAKRFGGGSTTDNAVSGVAVDSSNNVIVAGYFQGTIDFGSGLTNSGLYDIFVAKFSSTGTNLWAKTMGSPYEDFAYGVAVDKNSNIVVVGHYYSSAVVLKYDTNGNMQWGKTYGGGNGTSAFSVATDSGGNVIVAGSFQGAIIVNGATVSSSNSSSVDIFLMKLSPTGSAVWGKTFGSPSSDVAYGVAVDASDNVVMTGNFQGTMDFGVGSLTSSGYNTFIAKYSSTGLCLWAKAFGSANSTVNGGEGIKTDGSGNIIVTGDFTGTIDFGAGPLGSNGGHDIYVAKFSPAGTCVWAKSFGSTADDAGYSIDVDVSSGNVVTTGYFQGTVNFGGTNLTSAGNTDIFLLELAP